MINDIILRKYDEAAHSLLNNAEDCGTRISWGVLKNILKEAYVLKKSLGLINDEWMLVRLNKLDMIWIQAHCLKHVCMYLCTSVNFNLKSAKAAVAHIYNKFHNFKNSWISHEIYVVSCANIPHGIDSVKLRYHYNFEISKRLGDTI